MRHNGILNFIIGMNHKFRDLKQQAGKKGELELDFSLAPSFFISFALTGTNNNQTKTSFQN
jgi:hypothetical protein